MGWDAVVRLDLVVGSSFGSVQLWKKKGLEAVCGDTKLGKN